MKLTPRAEPGRWLGDFFAKGYRLVIQRATCPICKKPLEDEEPEKPSFRPFCSDRCRKVDLLRWWDGKYAIVEDLPPEAMDQELGLE